MTRARQLRRLGWCAAISLATPGAAQTNGPSPQRLSPSLSKRLGGPGGVPLGGEGSLPPQPAARSGSAVAPAPPSTFQDLAAQFGGTEDDAEAPR